MSRWSTTGEMVSALPDGGRHSHASVVLTTDSNNTNDRVVVVLGGRQTSGWWWNLGSSPTHSVLLLRLDPSSSSVSVSSPKRRRPQWQYGPPMIQARWCLAAVVCHDFLYAIGGGIRNDTMERIPLSALRVCQHDHHTDPPPSSSGSSSWQLLATRLTDPRFGASAVALYNRYLIVLGGYNHDAMQTTGSVDIVDTQPTTCSKNHPNETTSVVVVKVSQGPSMTIPRTQFGAVVWKDSIWVVGGLNDTQGCLSSMEVLSFHSNHNHNNNPTTSDSASLTVSSSGWTLQHQLSLPMGRHAFAASLVDHFFVLVGGQTDRGRTLEDCLVVDLEHQHGLVLGGNIPPSRCSIPRSYGSLVSWKTHTSDNHNNNNNNKKTTTMHVMVLGGINSNGWWVPTPIATIETIELPLYY